MRKLRCNVRVVLDYLKQAAICTLVPDFGQRIEKQLENRFNQVYSMALCT